MRPRAAAGVVIGAGVCRLLAMFAQMERIYMLERTASAVTFIGKCVISLAVSGRDARASGGRSWSHCGVCAVVWAWAGVEVQPDEKPR
jgi:hypothetical protein